MAYLALTGGVGGAKLALGLSRLLGPEKLAFAVNTGDDFEHLGLHISPDLDTLTYTLAGENNPKTGWGRRNETWQFMSALEALGGETWFRLGDKDLALHVLRTQMLRQGATLTEAAARAAAGLGVVHRILPMTDDQVRTLVHTDRGWLAFQHYFVRDRCQPRAKGFAFAGASQAAPNPAILAALEDCQGIVLCPSNPFVSIDPILAVRGMREALRRCSAPLIAVSPIVAGAAIKGPTAKMMRELKLPVAGRQVAEHYGDLLDGFLLDERDASQRSAIEVPTSVAQSVMISLDDRVRLAEAVLGFLEELRG